MRDIYSAAISDNDKEKKQNLWGQIYWMIAHRKNPTAEVEGHHCDWFTYWM